MNYLLHVITIAAFYTMLAQSLTFFSGNTRLLSLVHAGFYGLGAYAWAIASKGGVPLIFVPFLIFAVIAVASLLTSLVAFRTKNDYFVIITLSLQMLIFNILNNLSSITNGPLGISSIPNYGGLSSQPGMAVVAVFSAGIVYFGLWRLSRSAWGKNLRAIRDDDVMMMSLGKPVARIKTITFVISAMIAGCVGALFAQYVTFIDPTSFTISESIIILAIVIVGGLGNIHGAFVAALVLTSLPEIIRFIGIPGVAEGNARQIIYGAALVMIMLLRGRRSRFSGKPTAN